VLTAIGAVDTIGAILGANAALVLVDALTALTTFVVGAKASLVDSAVTKLYLTGAKAALVLVAVSAVLTDFKVGDKA
jgi:hypothetical protein